MRVVKICGLVLAVLLAGVGLAGEKTEFVATDFFNPFGMFSQPVSGSFIERAVISCPGHEPTGNPLQPCPPGSNVHLRGSKYTVHAESTDIRVRGWYTVIANTNWDADETGPFWGTISIAVDGGGMWEGTLEGQRSLEGNRWVAVGHVVAHGTQGPVEGLVMRGTETQISPLPMPMFYTGTLTGVILEPGKH